MPFLSNQWPEWLLKLGAVQLPCKARLLSIDFGLSNPHKVYDVRVGVEPHSMTVLELLISLSRSGWEHAHISAAAAA
jgi:hypothetical protein